MLRTLAILCAATALALTACGPKEVDTAPQPTGDPEFPDGWQTWTRVNEATIVREEEGVARDIYARVRSGLGLGTVIVKAEHSIMGGQRGALNTVAVMKRTGSGSYAGWTFMAFEPGTRTRLSTNDTTCVSCHTLQEDQEYLFTPESALRR